MCTLNCGKNSYTVPDQERRATQFYHVVTNLPVHKTFGYTAYKYAVLAEL